MTGANQAVKRVAARLERILKLDGWRITIAVHDGCLNGDKGEITVLPEYRVASITIDPSAHKDEEDLIKTVCHEYLHVVLSPFEAAKRVIQAGLDREPEIVKIADCALAQAEELIISHLEQIGFPYDQL